MIYVIAGHARNGKDSTADIIVKHTNNCIKLAYADYLKLYCKRFFGWDGSEETKPRELLQQLGTDTIRMKLNKPDFHVNRIIEDIEILSSFFDNFVIPDCRFPNECSLMRDAFGNKVKIIKVVRDNFTNNLTEEQRNHPSETALDNYIDFDHIIHAENLQELERKVLTFI